MRLNTLLGNNVLLSDLEKTDEHYILRVYVPGIKKEDIEVLLPDLNTLTVRVKGDKTERSEGWSICEYRSLVNAERTYRFDDEIDSANAVVELQDGILKLTLPYKKIDPVKLEIK